MMQKEQLLQLMQQVAAGTLPPEEAAQCWSGQAEAALDYASLDHDRERRRGFPEVVYAEGKSPEQVLGIVRALAARSEQNILATRCSAEMWQVLQPQLPQARYHAEARLLCLEQKIVAEQGLIAVVCAGTSDLPIAEEAALTAHYLGNRVERFYDVGVAGLHRLLRVREQLAAARVLVVVAGMEGALPSVVSGLVGKPVIAVPTSVGYGASFHGVAALLGMLNSCSSGVSVVNIDNGFGGGYAASLINKLA